MKEKRKKNYSILAFIFFSVMNLGILFANEPNDLVPPCPTPIEKKVHVGEHVTFDLMSCLTNPDGYHWERYANANWPKRAKLSREGVFSWTPTIKHLGVNSLMAVATHGGSDFYFFPLEITVTE